MCWGLRQAVAQARAVEVEYRHEGEQVQGELNLAADPVLREIYESDLRPILAASVELVAVFVGPAIPMAFRLAPFCFCSALSIVTETTLPQRSAERKVDYRD